MRRPDELPTKAENLDRNLDTMYRIQDMLGTVGDALKSYVGRNGQDYDAVGELEDFADTVERFKSGALISLNAGGK